MFNFEFWQKILFVTNCKLESSHVAYMKTADKMFSWEVIPSPSNATQTGSQSYIKPNHYVSLTQTK